MRVIVVVLCFLFSNSSVFSQGIKNIKGTWKGAYICRAGETGVVMKIKPISDNQFVGTFKFYPISSNPSTIIKKGQFTFTGEFITDKNIIFKQNQWLKKPENYEMIDFIGSFDGVGTIEGKITTDGCTTFIVNKK
jgi:hypothetical protein